MATPIPPLALSSQRENWSWLEALAAKSQFPNYTTLMRCYGVESLTKPYLENELTTSIYRRDVTKGLTIITKILKFFSSGSHFNDFITLSLLLLHAYTFILGCPTNAPTMKLSATLRQFDLAWFLAWCYHQFKSVGNYQLFHNVQSDLKKGLLPS